MLIIYVFSFSGVMNFFKDMLVEHIQSGVYGNSGTPCIHPVLHHHMATGPIFPSSPAQ